MAHITIPKKEYDQLKKHSRAYKRVATKLFSAIVKDSVSDIVADFRKTGLYTKNFISDLEIGLKKSSYGK